MKCYHVCVKADKTFILGKYNANVPDIHKQKAYFIYNFTPFDWLLTQSQPFTCVIPIYLLKC